MLILYLITDECYRKVKVAANYSYSSHSLPGAFGFVYIWVITTGKGVTVCLVSCLRCDNFFFCWFFFFFSVTIQRSLCIRRALEGFRAPPDHTGGIECWTLHSPVGVLHSSALPDFA